MEDLTDGRQLGGARYSSTATLRRLWQMITHVGLSDLMPAVPMKRIQEETHEHRAEAKVPQASAAEVETEEASAMNRPRVAESSPRMHQFARALPEPVESEMTDPGIGEAAVLRRARRAVGETEEHGSAAKARSASMQQAPGVRRKAADAKRAARPRAASSAPVADRAAPEVSVDTAIEGLAGRRRRVSAQMADDEMLRDMLAQRERAIERGR